MGHSLKILDGSLIVPGFAGLLFVIIAAFFLFL
jgi:hypothetical protein